jgi:hypothetical protein
MYTTFRFKGLKSVRMRAAFPSHLATDFITLIIFYDEDKLRSSLSNFLHSFDQSILLSALSSNTLPYRL